MSKILDNIQVQEINLNDSLIHHFNSNSDFAIKEHIEKPLNVLLLDFMKSLAQISFEYQKSKEYHGENAISTTSHERKDNGIYYTDIYLAQKLANKAIQNYVGLNGIEKLAKVKFFEPCNGVGVFTFAYLIESQKILEKNFKSSWKQKLHEQIRNIYVADVDREALFIFKFLLEKFCSILNIKFDLELIENNFWEKGLIYQVIGNEVEWVDFEVVKEHFKINDSFDIILTNPPYKKLKAEKQQYQNNNQFENAKKIYSGITTKLRKKSNLKYSLEGTLNLYKLFTEAILEEYSKTKGAVIGLLIPYNILMDLQCQKLRDMMLDKHKLIEVITFQENNIFFTDSTQSLCFLVLEAGGQTDDVKFLDNINDVNDFTEKEFITTPIQLIKTLTTSKTIMPLLPIEKSILEKTVNHKMLQQYEDIKILRGELDLTLGKKFIINDLNKDDGCLPLLRGNSLGNDYTIKEIGTKEWVLAEEFKQSSIQKAKFITRERIACQQIVNMKKRKRISFSKIKPNNVLANSCNFIALESDLMTLDAILGYMNSSFVDWRFKLTSSNNHVNNYELLEIPLPDPELNSSRYNKIHTYVQKYLISFDDKYHALIDSEVFKLFNFRQDEVIHILTSLKKPLSYITSVLFLTFNEKVIQEFLAKDINYLEDNPQIKNEFIELIKKKYSDLSEGKILNHFLFKLSDLDIEMIKNVPPGGNWKNIPGDVVVKSERLKKINQTGGRTTLYGRIEWTEPSYTITTYFNRPGNGTYVHPQYNPNNIEETQNRVITPREAARLQSFPDYYQFIGNKKDILLQIGNAVPPMLAYQIAKKIKQELNSSKAMDLFSGAGGMSEGFRKAGYNILVSNDFAEAACKTYQLNHPETKVVHGDITLPEIKEELYKNIDNEEIDIIFGGPPCQGFSHAGKRFIDDPRNYLFKEFVEVVKEVKPKIFIMENVEGLLSSNGGKTFEGILESFKELGYNIEGRKLNSAEYGVPQKRKRVIVIGVRSDLYHSPANLFPEPLFTDGEINKLDLFSEEEKINSYVTVKEAFSTLPIEFVEDDNHRIQEFSSYSLLMKNVISFEQFIMLKKYEKNTNER